MRAWEELSKREQLEAIWWDLHKDVYGFRPRSIDTSKWTEADFQAELDRLEAELGIEEKRREEQEAEAVRRLEYRIQALMHHGARNRAMAIRWLDEAYETDGEWDRLEWNLGIPFGYFASKGDVAKKQQA